MDPVLPNGFHGSLTFAPRVTSYNLLAQRIRRFMGEPLVQVEISSEQIYDVIDYSCEFFSKFAATTEEFLIFNSGLYIPGLGLPIGRLINLSSEQTNPENPDTSNSSLSAGWDFDLNKYRNVVDVWSYEEGNNTGVNTLFTIENTIAQQAYFGQLLGNVGYDLITWQALKGWLDTRDKVLALTPYLRFDPYTQVLKIIPEPDNTNPYFGLVGCRMQMPIRDVVSQLWVFRHALACAKILVGHARTKFKGTNLFGGQQVNGDDLIRQGEAEKTQLEQEMITNSMDSTPAKFFIG